MYRRDNIRKQSPKSRDIKFLLKNGRKKSNDFFSVYTIENPGKKPAVFTAGIAKKAVAASSDRNLYKRRIRAVLQKHMASLAGLKTLVMPRHKISALKSYAEIEEKLVSLLPAPEGKK